MKGGDMLGGSAYDQDILYTCIKLSKDKEYSLKNYKNQTKIKRTHTHQ